MPRHWLNLSVYQYPLWLADLRNKRVGGGGFIERIESFGIVDFEIDFVQTRTEQFLIDYPTILLVVERKEAVPH